VSADPGPRILVVDDVPKNVRLLEAVLIPNSYTVTTASTGPEALEKVRAELPDLVLLDIQMPGMDGYEVCRRLRADPATRFLPVVMITSSDSEVRVNALEADADDFIMKPFDQQELLARVRSLVRIKHYHDTIEAQAAELAGWNRTLEARVDEQTKELRASRARVVSAADAERRRIERDLHDGAQQHLIGLAVRVRLARDLADAEPAKTKELLDLLGDDVQETLEQLRDLAHGIYPPLLQDRGLSDALRAVAVRAPIKTRIEVDGIGRFEPDVEATVYFCCLEALQNASKYAGRGATASVNVHQVAAELLFEVADDGGGFDIEARGDGVGLTNMRDRVGAIGGSLRIESSGGRGTTISGSIPLRG
jgi:signal transduction histidine kinase